MRISRWILAPARVVVVVLVVLAVVPAVVRLIAEVIRFKQRHGNNNARTNYVLVGFFVLVACVGIATWLKFATPESPYTQLKKNGDFMEAQIAFNDGQWTQAISSYKQALANTGDANQRLAIYYYLAAAENISGQHVEAIPLLKQVAAAKSLSKEVRAYAAQYMGIMALNLSNPVAHDAIIAEVFKDAPYKEMRVANDDALSIRHLFEYASSLFPLGISEANISKWYIENIVSNKLSTTTEPGLSNIKLIKQRLVNADADIKRIKESQMSSNLIPQIYARKAEAIGGLSQVGVVPKEQALQAYARALESYSEYNTLPGDDWFLRFSYASFLAYSYGPSRQSDIHNIAAPLYLDPVYTTSAKPFLTTLSKTRLTQTPETALENNVLKAWRIGKIDSYFKNFLVSLGWSENNF